MALCASKQPAATLKLTKGHALGIVAATLEAPKDFFIKLMRSFSKVSNVAATMLPTV